MVTVQALKESRLVLISVKRSEAELVAPADDQATHKGPYFLSNLDLYVAFPIRTIFCFKSTEKGNGEAADVIKEALRKVLVHYYPLTGRFATGADGKLTVDCTGEGVVFVEAEADGCNDMEEVEGILTNGDPQVLGNLVYDGPCTEKILDMPPLTVQITKFSCGGFVLGVRINHCMVDGKALVGFLKSWGETARGLPLSTPLFLERTVLKARNPPEAEFLHHEFMEMEDKSGISQLDLQEGTLLRSFLFEPQKLMELKEKAVDELCGPCTTFEALSALIWKVRTQSLGLLADQEIKLLLPIDGRSKLSPPLPEGYFGNGIVLANAICKAGELLEKPLSFAVGLVQDAIKRSITDRYIRSVIDYYEATRASLSVFSTLVITTWTRLPFHTTDFGWGQPCVFGPIGYDRELVTFLPHGRDGKTIRVLLALPPSAMNIFQQLVIYQGIGC